MIEKTITFIYGDSNSDVFSLIHPDTLEKQAGISEEIHSYITNLKKQVNKTYALINALSAGEFYGANRNGDYFPEDALDEYHKTFEEFGHVYKHHVNKDPNIALGKVIFSFYNKKMHRVELIVELDNTKAKDLLEDFKKGKLPATSMGTKVPYDVCSICGNRAKTRSEYCTHLKNDLGKIYPGGKQVAAINTKPKFFDISIVFIPADRTSSILKVLEDLLPGSSENALKKVASHIENSYIKFAGLTNTAEISKNIEGDVKALSDDPKKLAKIICLSQENLDKETIDKLAEFNFTDILSTFHALRVLPTPADFQKLALYSKGMRDIADELEANDIVFDIPEKDELTQDLELETYNEKIASIIIDELPKVALTKEYLVSRMLTKIADYQNVAYNNPEFDGRAIWKKVLFDDKPKPVKTPHKNPIVPLGILGGLYYGYAKLFSDPNASQFRKFMLKNPWLLPVIIGGVSAGSLLAQDGAMQKSAGKIPFDGFMRNSLISFPLSYYASAKKEINARKGQPITGTEDFIRKHPALIGLAGAFAGTKVENLIKQKLTKVATLVNRLPEKELNKIYTDLINL